MELTPDTKPTASDWRLTACCRSGLANRINVLISGMALAEATGRSFRMLWPLSPGCAAPFEFLFENNWNVTNIAAKDLASLPPRSDWRYERLPDLLKDRTPHLVAHHTAMLIRPSTFPAHQPLHDRCLELFQQLVPVAYIREQVDRFQKHHFRPEMIGVHLRRGDMVRSRPDAVGNTSHAMAAVDDFLTRSPDAGIFLSTDDGATDTWKKEVQYEGVLELFRKRFGERVVSTQPRSLDRRTPEAIQDAMVDLLLLRQTHMFVGSRGSTYSEMVVYGRKIPSVKCAGKLPSYERFERWAKLTGFYYLLIGAGWCYYRRRLSLSVIWRLWIGRFLHHRYVQAWMRR